MKIELIKSVVEKFLKGDDKGILIDGPWGSEKTHQIGELLKRYDENETVENKIHYISLFGKESIEEINTELYYKVYPDARKNGNIKKIAGNVIKLIPFVANIVEGIDFTLSKRIIEKSGDVVVFDDMKRVSPNLSFGSLMGYIHQLFFSKVKIVGICSSENIDDEDKLKEFRDFQEKVFDRISTVSA